MSFTYQIDNNRGVGIIHLEGRLMEKYDASSLLEEVKDSIAQGMNRFVIDLKKLEYINSSGLNVLITILTQSRNDGGETIICNLSPRLEKLFVITRLDTVFQLAATQAAALQVFKNTEKQNEA
ncbi:MAG: STAS domain-containing protein [Bacteroidia bacterium]|jgi:anti-sigma B factor antagonist|nr:STAS domain-containing protein [Bacteroidia bacterium]MCC6767890.1 STAS domain-containing protein [Bacteroidia bacterium]